MADKTGIEWTNATWNPIIGCSVVSPGCTNCYAMGMAARIEAMNAGSHYVGTTQKTKAGPVWNGKLVLAPQKLLMQPLRWTQPRRIFVNSMGDLFHESVPDEWIDKVFAIMALCPQHTFQVLTKRSARMRKYFKDIPQWRWMEQIKQILPPKQGMGVILSTYNQALPNVWLGVSTEDQKRADERIPDLLQVPAAVRFISAEPLLGEIDLKLFVDCAYCDFSSGTRGMDRCGKCDGEGFKRSGRKLDWVIVGGESGHKARPMNPQWARYLRDQCAAAGVAFFFKQWGEFVSVSEVAGPGEHYTFADYRTVRRVGKKKAGRLLDGREHNDMPKVAA